ncbi:unnamed protein product, partial [marine sediment metagenome]
ANLSDSRFEPTDRLPVVGRSLGKTVDVRRNY